MFPLIRNFDAFADAVGDQPFSSDDFINKLSPTGPWDLVIQLLAFLVLILIVFFIGYKPVKKMVARRKEHIAREIAEAEEAKKVALDAAAKADSVVAEGKKQAASIVEAARAEGEAERAKILSLAEEEAAAKKKQADIDIALAKEKSRQEVRDEIVDVALLASEAVLGREVSEEDGKRLVASFVEDLEKGR